MARLFKLAYQWRIHRFGDWSLQRWMSTLAWLALVVIAGPWFIRGRPALPAWYWAVPALLAVAAVGWPVLAWLADRRGYLSFRGEHVAILPAGLRMAPEDKVAVRATGTFEVGEKRRFFADIEAYWRTYGSREHAVLAKADPSRFFLLGNTPPEVRGMWYLFFRPHEIRAIEAGQAVFGADARPGLRIAYMVTPSGEGGKRRKKPYRAVCYLRFEDAGDRDKVWADLRFDLAGGNGEPALPASPGQSNGKLRL